MLKKVVAGVTFVVTTLFISSIALVSFLGVKGNDMVGRIQVGCNDATSSLPSAEIDPNHCAFPVEVVAIGDLGHKVVALLCILWIALIALWLFSSRDTPAEDGRIDELGDGT